MLEFWKMAEKKGIGKAIVLLLVYTSITSGPAWLLGYNQGANSITVESSQNNFNLAASALSGFDSAVAAEEKCEVKNFSENTKKWILNQYQGPDKDGFYCPSFISGFPSPNMWHKEQLSLGFKSTKVTFEVRDMNLENKTGPAFIFTLGNVPTVLRFYVAEASPQIIGFEHIDIDNENLLVRSEPTSLRDPMKNGTQAELTVRPLVLQGNNVRFTFNVSYISELTGDLTEDNFSYDVKLPVPQPESANVDFGIGTFKGSCIKPIAYEICQ